jgi:hypothetical protein
MKSTGMNMGEQVSTHKVSCKNPELQGRLCVIVHLVLISLKQNSLEESSRSLASLRSSRVMLYISACTCI